MSGIGARSKIFCQRNKSLEAIVRACFVLRSLSSRPRDSYVHDIRKQMTLKRSKSNEDLPYKEGRFFVIDLAKDKVLLSAKPQDRYGRKSLSWIRYEDSNKIGVTIEENALFLRVAGGEPNFVVNVSKVSDEAKHTLESKANAKFIALRSSLFSSDGSIDMPLVSQQCAVGETIEENIKREVAEELGLEAKNIQYIGSQHWSSPGSKLMIGCFATVADENFSIDSEELEEACWFNPQQIHNALKRVTEKREKALESPDDIWIPPPGAIAHSLIKLWLQKHG